MKQFNGYSEAKKAASASGSKRLPLGNYVAKIMAVRYENGENGNSDRIVVQYDIAEGEQKDFFKTQYEESTDENKKWKGVAQIWVPTDDGSEKDGWTKRTFANWTDSIEKSNLGYTWDWDEKKWKGKFVGLVFGETGDVMERQDGTKVEFIKTEIRFPISADKVREGKAPEGKWKAVHGYIGKQNNETQSNFPSEFLQVAEDGDIPF